MKTQVKEHNVLLNVFAVVKKKITKYVYFTLHIM